MDETSWAFHGYGGDVVNDVSNKPSVNRGGQTTIYCDVKTGFPRAYVHRWRKKPYATGFTSQGQSEVAFVMEQLTPQIKGKPQGRDDKKRQVFVKPPHIAMDNHFSGDAIAVKIGEENYAGTWMCARGRLPKGIPKKCLHHLRSIKTWSLECKVARYINPVVFVKDVKEDTASGKHAYRIVHTSFQSIGGTNLQSVNALSKVSLYVHQQERGRGAGKRRWGIEMNEHRQLYLGNYCTMDQVDAEIKSLRQ